MSLARGEGLWETVHYFLCSCRATGSLSSLPYSCSFTLQRWSSEFRESTNERRFFCFLHILPPFLLLTRLRALPLLCCRLIDSFRYMIRFTLSRQPCLSSGRVQGGRLGCACAAFSKITCGKTGAIWDTTFGHRTCDSDHGQTPSRVWPNIMHHAVRNPSVAGISKKGKLIYKLGKSVPVPFFVESENLLPISQLQGSGAVISGSLASARNPVRFQDMLTDNM